MVADRARRQFDAVADDVVLERLQPEDGVLVVGVSARNSSRPSSASRTGCGRSRSSSPPRSTRTSENRRSSRTRSASFSRQSELAPRWVRAAPASLAARSGLSAAKNTASPAVDASPLRRSRCCALGGKELGNRTLAGESAVALEDDVAEPRRALPRAHSFSLSKKLARLRAGAGRGNRAHDTVLTS